MTAHALPVFLYATIAPNTTHFRKKVKNHYIHSNRVISTVVPTGGVYLISQVAFWSYFAIFLAKMGRGKGRNIMSPGVVASQSSCKSSGVSYSPKNYDNSCAKQRIVKGGCVPAERKNDVGGIRLLFIARTGRRRRKSNIQGPWFCALLWCSGSVTRESQFCWKWRTARRNICGNLTIRVVIPPYHAVAWRLAVGVHFFIVGEALSHLFRSRSLPTASIHTIFYESPHRSHSSSMDAQLSSATLRPWTSAHRIFFSRPPGNSGRLLSRE